MEKEFNFNIKITKQELSKTWSKMGFKDWKKVFIKKLEKKLKERMGDDWYRHFGLGEIINEKTE